MAGSRRGFLKKSLGGAALLLAAGAVPIALRKTKLRASPALRFFTPAEYSIWAAMSARVLAAQPPDIDVAAKADAFCALLSPADQKEMKRLLALFDNALFSLVAGGPAMPFTEMSPEDQDAQLASWQQSRLAIKRSGFQAMKRLTCALYFSDPATYASVGYPGPPYQLVKDVLEARK